MAAAARSVGIVNGGSTGGGTRVDKMLSIEKFDTVELKLQVYGKQI